MPPVLSTLFTTTSDIASMLGCSGLELRIDDAGATSGTITGATQTAPIALTSASHGLNTGDMVQVQGVRGLTWANGLWVVTYIDANTFSLDNSDGTTVNAYTTGGTWKGITYPESGWIEIAPNWGTAKVLRMTQTLYDAADLVNSWSVWFWATVIGAHWFCARRGNPVPGSINNYYLETMDELAMVQSQEMIIEGTAYRNDTQATWSALRVDRRWSVKQLRVEATISGRTAPQFPRKWDLSSQVIGPAEINSIN